MKTFITNSRHEIQAPCWKGAELIAFCLGVEVVGELVERIQVPQEVVDRIPIHIRDKEKEPTFAGS